MKLPSRMRIHKVSTGNEHLIFRALPEERAVRNLVPIKYRPRTLPRTKMGRLARWGSIGLVSIILGLALTVSGGVGSNTTSTAQAGITDFWCGYKDQTDSFPLSTANGSINDNPAIALPKVPAATAYEWYGIGGLTWNNNNYKALDSGCLDVMSAGGNLIADIFFYIDTSVADVSAGIYGWMTNINAFDSFLGVIDNIFLGPVDKTKSSPTYGQHMGDSGLVNTLFLKWLGLIVLAGSLKMGWEGLVKKRSSQAIQSAIWMFTAATCSLIFLLHPTAIANTVNTATSRVSTDLISVVSTAGTSVGGSQGGTQDLCYLPSGTSQDTPNWAQRTAQCTIWSVFAYQPWANGQFGTALAQAPVNWKGTYGTNGNTTTYTQMGQSYNLRDGVTIPGHAPVNTVALQYLNAHTINYNDANHNPPIDSIGKGTLGANARHTVQNAIVYDTIKDKYIAAYSVFNGSGWINRLGIAGMDFIAMIAGAIPILIISFNLILLQLTLVILMLMAPFFLTIGVYPGAGRRITMTWLEMVLSSLLKRLGNAFVLGILLLLLETIVTMGGNWIIQVLFIIGTTIALMQARHKIIKQMNNVNLGGNGSSADLDQSLKKSGHRMFKGGRTVVKEGFAFEGGFTKGVASGLIGRNAHSRQLATAGKDVKAMFDPMRRIKKTAEKSLNEKSQQRAAQATMDATPLDQMDDWAKYYKKTNQPVPRPRDKAKLKWLEDNGVDVMPETPEETAEQERRFEADFRRMEDELWRQKQKDYINGQRQIDMDNTPLSDMNKWKQRYMASNNEAVPRPDDEEKLRWLHEHAVPVWPNRIEVPAEPAGPQPEGYDANSGEDSDTPLVTDPRADYYNTQQVTYDNDMAERKANLIDSQNSLRELVAQTESEITRIREDLLVKQDSLGDEVLIRESQDRLTIQELRLQSLNNNIALIDTEVSNLDQEAEAWHEMHGKLAALSEDTSRPIFDLGGNGSINEDNGYGDPNDRVLRPTIHVVDPATLDIPEVPLPSRVIRPKNPNLNEE